MIGGALIGVARDVGGLDEDELIVRYQGNLLYNVQQRVLVLVDQNGPLNPLNPANKLVNRLIFCLDYLRRLNRHLAFIDEVDGGKLVNRL